MFEIHPVKKVSVVIPVYNEQESLPEINQAHHPQPVNRWGKSMRSC
ncbi:undecaprenyl phosphate 4-deoxy-4-formamido-L-arabinose transferase [Escherichia coli]|uniref:Undecaprenyl phosphate 4-deoxy-4-formamido-L-arabinose transferase n=1 Tax=Escherichia coli TaxID=562 RepID=A0A2X3JF19_ECOLX|nr:undecaprenyl phosphate 4-deoxy-4-formamido-L-arabinose transferase [Escherichia coli]